MADLTQEQERNELHRAIWAMADDLRGSIGGWEFKSYVLGTMFYRYISENLTSYINKGEIEAGNPDFDYATLSDEEAEEARDDLIDEKGFFMLPSELFCNVRARAGKDENLNETLERVFHNIEDSSRGHESEKCFVGLFDDFDVNSNQLGATVQRRNERLVKLLNGIGELNLGDINDHNNDTFGDAYEFLMTMYAANAGKSGGEFFTPAEVSELLTRLGTVGKTKVNKVYDPACGSGSLLLKAKKVLGDEGVTIGYFGQEINLTSWNLCRINMFLHGVEFSKFDIACDDTLTNPQHWDDEPFELICTNPPYSVKWKGSDDATLINDPRFSPAGVLAPKSKADMAFVMHCLSWLAANGTAAIVCFPGIVRFVGHWTFEESALVDAATPAAISLTSTAYEAGDAITALNGATTVTDDGVLSYQWYVSDKTDNFEGTPIEGATSETYTPTLSEVGTYYYYVVASNTKEEATGNKVSSTTSNMAVITIREKGTAATYTVSYDWGNEFPASETLPTNGNTYQTEFEAKAAVDTRYSAGFVTNGQKDGKDGPWTFSGWTVSVEGTVVKFSGNWSFVEKRQNTSGSSGSSSGGGTNSTRYSIETKAVEHGKVTFSASQAAKGNKVTLTIHPDDGYKLSLVTVKDSKGNTVEVTKQTEDAYSFIMPAGNVSVEPTFEKVLVPSMGFRDVKKSDYFYDAVLWAVENGITTGSGTDTFSPYDSCICAQIVTFLWRTAGSPEPKTMSSFSDVPSDAYFAKAVAWAVENGITTGTSADKFSPYAACTRAQSVAFLYRAAGSPVVESGVSFRDVNPKDFFANAVAWAEKNGIASGIGNGLFGANQKCTRGQIVSFLYRQRNL